MDDVAVLIFAGTSPDCVWHHTSGRVRQLLPIGGEPLLIRTLGQLAKLGYDATVVTDKPEIFSKIPNCFVPPIKRRRLTAAMLDTRELWDDKTVFLPGDVVWDIYVLGVVLASRRLPRFFGSGAAGIHAMSFLREHFDKVETALEETEARLAKDDKVCWFVHFYRVFCGMDIYSSDMKSPWPNWFTIRTTGTPNKSCVTDFDTLARYEKWYRKHYGCESVNHHP